MGSRLLGKFSAVAGLQSRLIPALPHSGPQLRDRSDIQTKINLGERLPERELADLVTVVVNIFYVPVQLDLGLYKDPLPHFQRLIEPGTQHDILAKLDRVAPLATVGVQPGSGVLTEQCKGEIAPSRETEAQVKLQKIGSP